MKKKISKTFSQIWELFFYSLGVGVILFFDTGLINKYNLPKTTWVYFLCLAAIPLFLWGLEKISIPPKSFWILLLIIAGFSLISAFSSMDTQLSLWGTYGRKDGIITFLAFLFLAFLASSVPLKKGFVRSFLVLSLFCGALSTLYGVEQFLGHDFIAGLTEGERIRPIGTIGGVNAAAGLLALLFPGIFALAFKTQNAKKLLVFSLFGALFFLGLLLSYCRGAWLAAFLGSFLVLILSFKSFSKKSLLNLAVFILFLLPMPFLQGKLLHLSPGEKSVNPDLQAISENSLGERLASTVNVKDSTIQSRGELWKIAIQIWKKYPLFGPGPETFSYFHGRLRGPEETLKYGTGATAKHAHNIIFHYLATRGLLGTLPILILWVWTLWFGFKTILEFSSTKETSESLICFSMLISGLLFSMTNVHTIPAETYIWVLVGLLWNPIINSKGKPLHLSLIKFQSRKRLILGLFVSLILGFYLFRPFIADALFLDTISTPASQITKKMEKYQKALEVFPDDRVYAENFVIWLNSQESEVQKENGCLILAKQICEQNLKKVPNDDEFLYLEARTLFLLFEETQDEQYLDRAEKNMEQLLSQIKYHLDGTLLMVQIELKKKNYEKALKWIDESMKWSGLDFVKKRLAERTIKIEHVRDCKIILYLSRLRGNILVVMGREKEAEKEYRKILEASPDDGLTYYNLGTLLARMGRYSEAEQVFVKTLEILPEHANAKINLDVVRKKLENKEE